MTIARVIPKRIQDMQDFAATLGVGTDGQAIIWDNDAGEFVLAAFLPSSSVSAFMLTLFDDADASAARATLGLGTAAVLNVGTSANDVVQLNGSAQLPAVDGSLLTGISGGSTTQVQYNNAGAFAGDSGMTYNAANDRLTVAGGLVAPSIRPASNSTTAIQLQNAAGTGVLTVDTTNNRIGIATISPQKALDVTGKIRAIASGFTSSLDPYIGAVGSSASTTDYPDIVVANRNFAGNSLAKLGFICGDGTAIGYFVADLAGFGTGTTYTSSGLDSPGIGIQVWTNHPFMLKTNNVERLRVQANGYVAIGQTSATALLDLASSTTARASLRIRSGTAPTSPNDGDIWYDGTHFYGRAAGVTKQLDN